VLAFEGLKESADESAIKWAVSFDFDSSAELPDAAISTLGEINIGIAGADQRVSKEEQLNRANTYYRSASLGEGKDKYTVRMYALYFPRDEDALGIAAHNYDWEYVLVWTMNELMTHAGFSAHGKVDIYSKGELDFDQNNTVKAVYHREGLLTHSFRPAKRDETAENLTGTWVKPTLVEWSSMSSNHFTNEEIRLALSEHDFGKAVCPLTDSAFPKEIAKNVPKGYPSAKQWVRLFGLNKNAAENAQARQNQKSNSEKVYDTAEKIVKSDPVQMLLDPVEYTKDRWNSLFGSGEHPAENWTDNLLQMPIRNLKGESSRLGNNIDKSPFTKQIQLTKLTFLNVRQEDLGSVKITLMADKGRARDRGRSRSHGHGEKFAVTTPTGDDRNYYPARLDAPGGREQFFKNNPNAYIQLEILDIGKEEGVVLCDGKDYMGEGYFLPSPSTVNVLKDDPHNFEGRTSSILIGVDTKVYLADHRKFGEGGKRIHLDASLSDLDKIRLNNRISSIEVRPE